MTNRSLRVAPLLLLAMAACDKDPSGGGSADGARKLFVDPPVPTLAPGATLQLSATSIDDDDNLKYGVRVGWRSLDPSVATVNGSGLLSGKAEGKARIVVSAGQVEDTATVFVSQTPLVGINTEANEPCEEVRPVGARVAATSQHAIILTDIENPAGGFTDADLQQVATAFDQVAWPVGTENFGQPTDIDGDGKIRILFTRRVNEETPPSVAYIVGGFFYVRDLFPRRETSALQGCPGSNASEIFYLLAPDPGGTINGNARSREYVRTSSLATLAHEFQHLINGGRRLLVNKVPGGDPFETVWLDEGLSHIAEELAFYRAAQLSPGLDLDRARLSAPGVFQPYDQYGDENTQRLVDYYKNPATNSPIADNDELATRGATWQFLRYAADRRGGNQRDFWFSLANSQTNGLPNLTAALGTDALTWLRDWSVAVYTDNTVPGIAPIYNQPSWNFRDVLAWENGGTYPLQVRTLASGATSSTSLRAGSGAYYRFGVAAGSRAELRTTSGGGTVPGECRTSGPALQLQVGQVFTGDPSNASVICLDGGVAGSEYVYIPFFSAQTGSLAVEVTPSGVVPVAAINAAWIPGGAAITPLARLREASVQPDGGFEQGLRQRERAQLSRLVRGSGARRAEIAAAQAPATLRISIVRTR